MKKSYMCLGLMICAVSVFAQNHIKGEKELLYTVPVYSGDSKNGISYYWSEEGIEYPVGPYVGKEGELYFLSSCARNRITKLSKGKTQEFYFKDNKSVSLYFYFDSMSENGINDMNFCLSEKNGGLFYVNSDWDFVNNNVLFPASFGSIVYDKKENETYGYVFSPVITPGNELYLRDTELIEEFLGFFNEDKNYSFNGGKISTKIKKSLYENKEYRCLLLSGHVLIRLDEGRCAETQYAVATPSGKIECYIDFPWVKDTEKYWANETLSCGTGNYGEIYTIIPPAGSTRKMAGGDGYHVEYNQIDKGNCEIAVVRNYLKDFGVLSADRVNLRSGPSTSTKSLGLYSIGTGFYIVERGTKEEVIGDNKGTWIKVRLHNQTEGYFFSPFVEDLYEGPNLMKNKKGSENFINLPWPNVSKYK